MGDAFEPRWLAMAREADVFDDLHECASVSVGGQWVELLADPAGGLYLTVTGGRSESFGEVGPREWSGIRIWGGGQGPGLTAAGGRLPEADVAVAVENVGEDEFDVSVADGCWVVGIAAFAAMPRIVLRRGSEVLAELCLPEAGPIPPEVLNAQAPEDVN